MKNYLCHLLVLSFLFIYGSASAQNDSAYFDLGRIQLRKDFTQHITIKGSDLEHMPFARVSDALAPWLHGTLTSKPKLVYVVDGNLLNDMDAYSIHDIEEITLIQNAVAQVNGSLNNQQLVLVKTKRRHESSKGITVAGSTYLANQDYPKDYNLESENALYHQYHLGAWQNLGRIRFGASANWMRDVSPVGKSVFETHKTPQLNRFRFNGWVDATLAAGHTLTLALNVSPQTSSQDITLFNAASAENIITKAKGTIINPSLRLSNRLTDEWLHELDLSYFTNRAPSDTRRLSDYFAPASANFESLNHTVFKSEQFLLRDRVSFTKNLGAWQIRPAVSFTYRNFKQETRFLHNTYSGGLLNSSSSGYSKQKGKSLVLTPAFNVSYRNAFNIGGGLAVKLEDDGLATQDDKIYPFVTAMIDVLRIGEPHNPNSLKIFGSFAKAGDFGDINYKQPDLSTDYDAMVTIPGGIYAGGTVLYTAYPEDAIHNDLQAGAVFSTPEDKLQFSYNFGNRKYLGLFFVPLPIGSGWDFQVVYPEYKLSTHRLGITARVLDRGDLQWLSGINVTGIKYDIEIEGNPSWQYPAEHNNDKMLWTGGWTNRLQLRKFFFGADLMHQFNYQQQVGLSYSFESFNTFRLNNIYAGYSFKICKGKPLEVYLGSRNLVQSDDRMVPDNRRYYGGGFKMQF